MLSGKLNEKAQGGKAPKWQPRSRVGIYLGHSPTHAGSVAMVLNPNTLHVSPQYHVVLTMNVKSMAEGTIPEKWARFAEHSSEFTTDEDIDLATSR